MNDERQLWRLGHVECVMISCCAGAELQLRRVRLQPDTTENREPATTDDRVPDTSEDRVLDTTEDGAIVRRELFPTKSDLYERARDLKAQAEREALQAISVARSAKPSAERREPHGNGRPSDG